MPDDARVIASPAAAPALIADALPIVVAQLPLSLQIFFDDNLFRRCQTIANYLADAGSFIAPHLVNKPKACFAVVSRALAWRLDPYAVAQATYETPGGQVGYMGSLCQAIIENSGRLDPSFGGVRFEFYGDWQRLRGRFRIQETTSQRSGKAVKYAVPAWKPEDEIGLGVMVRAKIKDEASPRELPFDLVQAFPRNSTLWATDPRTQICYTAVRRFGNVTVPTLFMGVPFDHETAAEWADTLKDVTPPPPPGLDEFTDSGAAAPRGHDGRTRRARGSKATTPGAAPREGGGAPAASYAYADSDGEVFEFADPTEAAQAYCAVLEAAAGANRPALAAAWENGEGLRAALATAVESDALAAIENLYAELIGPATPAAEPADDAPELTPSQDAGDTEVSRETDAAADPPAASTPAATPAASPAAADVSRETTPDAALTIAAAEPAQAWFQPARKLLREMHDRHAPGSDFQRFRALNQEQLERLASQFRSWHKILEAEIARGERGDA